MKIRFGAWRDPSAAAFAEQPAGRAIDQVQARTGRAGYRVMRIPGIGRRGREPMLNVHAGLRAFEDNMTVHREPDYDGSEPRPKLRMIA
ncbi:hypothetical protein GCM10007857_87960 [Bradyrhizobium iriomotense]|uniref:Uncharacterized protein n=1 Tax=Bradyrhizobium iriomotense TaxID=441950 RepID=A0ABQ6BCM8_9BRAD|nr:hypothetical protein GCM10007857_87960 [Bradyrhizobium iriomotense]